MLNVEIRAADGAIRQAQVADEAVIGKGAHNEIRLDSWRVGREHARLFRTPAGVLVEDLGAFGGVQVNGRRVEGQYGPLRSGDAITIGPFTLQVDDHRVGSLAVPVRTAPSGQVGAPGGQADAPRARSSAVQSRGERADEALRTSRQAAERAQKAAQEAGAISGYALVVTPDVTRDVTVDATRIALEFSWRKQLHASLLATMDLRRHDTHNMPDQQLRTETERLLRQIVQAADTEIPPELDRDILCRQVLDEALGLGPLEVLLADDSVSEIMVNRFDEIYVERRGRLEKAAMAFTGDRAVLGVIERIVAPLGRRIDESSPMVDARLKDGSRVNAIIAPLALKGPCLTIRKFARRKLGVEDLVQFDAISPEMAQFLELCVTARKNIIVSGGTGSGKTTLLNILSNFIPAGERIVTVEDAAELKLHHAHLVSLESRPANVEGRGGVSIRELVRNTLRMRPDRIVVGECRGAEALDMLQAMNTGHEGSLTTLHANSARDALARLETMVLMAGMDLPLQAIREQVASAVHVIVQQTRFACGARKVTGITEITGMESGIIQIQALFCFVNQGYDSAGGNVRGYFTGCEMVPGFYDALRATGKELDLSIFKQTAPESGQRQAAEDAVFGGGA